MTDINRGYVIFDGVDTRTFDVYMTGENAYSAAKKRDSEVTVPGRSGTLTLSGPAVWDDIDQIYPCFIPTDYSANIEGLRNALSAVKGKARLTDCYHPDEYMLAKFVDGLKAETAPMAVAGSFDLTFRRDPRRYLISGEMPITITSGDTLTNPTLMPSRPLLQATGSGEIVLGDQTITITGISSGTVIYIDCDMMDAYTISGGAAEDANANIALSSNDFPEIPAGETGVTYTCEALTIIPRWWRL